MRTKLCEMCGKTKPEHDHHLFEQTQANRRKYGALLDRRENIMYLCSPCHLNGSVEHISEAEFCRRLGLPLVGKSAQIAAIEEWFENHKSRKNIVLSIKNGCLSYHPSPDKVGDGS